MKFLGIYALINLVAVLAQFGRVLLIMLSGLRASRKVRFCMFGRVISLLFS